MFIAALFIIARTWKQPKCLSTDDWIRKLWYIYTMEYYSAIKKNTFESVLMRWMKLEPIIQSEVSQKEKVHGTFSRIDHILGHKSSLGKFKKIEIIPPSPSPTESKKLFYTSVSLFCLVYRGYCYCPSKFHIYALVYCIGIFLSGLLHSV